MDVSACLIDSSAFISLEARDEERHSAARQTFGELVAAGTDLVTTNFVFDETYTFLLARLGRTHAVTWGEHHLHSQIVRRVRVTEEHERRAWGIINAFVDKAFSYTDATSFAVAEALGIDSAFAFDEHFVQYGRLRVLP